MARDRILRRDILLMAFCGVAAVALLTPVVHGAEVPVVLCDGLPGCGSDPANVFQESILPAVLDLLFKIVGAAALLGIIWGGVLMLASQGDDGKVGNGRKSVLYSLGGLALALSANALVSFFVTEDWGNLAGGDLLFEGLFPAAIRIILTLFNIGVIIVIIFAGFRMAMSRGKQDDFRRGSMAIMWAAIGAIVVNASKAIIQAFLDRTISW